jgi:hypothetical protein
MYMNHIISNNYNESCSLLMVCSWMYFPWLSSAFVLDHMHSTLPSITIIMWIAYMCIVKIIPENYIRIDQNQTQKNGNNVAFVHFNLTFWITTKSNHFMPYFLVVTFSILHVKQATSNKDIGRSHPFLIV